MLEKWSLDDLYLAFRQAKLNAVLERRGTELVKFARYEDELSANLESLRARLASSNWFDQIEIGEILVAPKGFHGDTTSSENITRVGRVGDANPRKLEVRVLLSPSPEFSIVEVLYLWEFGPVLQSVLIDECLGYRLNLRDGRISRTTRYIFEYWAKQYQLYRTRPLDSAKELLDRNVGEPILIVSGDFRSFYDSIDPEFMLSERFFEQLSSGPLRENFDKIREEYQLATRSLEAAYSRYRSRVEELSGKTCRTGIPIGAATSRVVANLVLSEFDPYVRQRPGVHAYFRYVDDFVIVSKSVHGTSESLQHVLESLLPLSSAENDTFRIDGHAVSRPSSSLELQSKKVKAIELSGVQGQDFLEAVLGDFLHLVSENRAFINEKSFDPQVYRDLLRPSRQGVEKLRVLRDADRTRLERFALSSTLGSLEKVARLCRGDDTKRLVLTILAKIDRTGDLNTIWIEDLDLQLRILCLTIAVRAWDECAKICDKLNHVWKGLEEYPDSVSVLTLKGVDISSQSTGSRQSLSVYLLNRRLEALLATLPQSLDRVDFETAFPEPMKVFGSWKYEDVMSAVASLNRAGLNRFGEPVAATDTHWIVPNLAESSLVNRLDAIKSFMQRAEDQQLSDWPRVHEARLFLGRRVPSYLDVALVHFWDLEQRDLRSNEFESILKTVNAIRGTSYRDTIGEVHDDRIFLLSSGYLAQDFLDPPALLLGNLCTENSAFLESLEVPNQSLDRLNRLAVVIAKAKLERVAQGSKKALLVLPELALPRAWFREFAEHLVKHERIALVVGLEYHVDRSRKRVKNQVLGVFPAPYRSVSAFLWSKGYPAHVERKELSDRGYEFEKVNFPRRQRLVLDSPWGRLSVLICSELLELEQINDLKRRVELILCPAWNRDLGSYEHVIQSVGLKTNSIVAISNNGVYSDCRAWAPFTKSHQRTLARLHQQGSNSVAWVKLPLQELRKFRQGASKEFKPLPPDWCLD